jgi:hypothetical protein
VLLHSFPSYQLTMIHHVTIDADVNTLKSIELHSTLKSETRKTLMDCVDVLKVKSHVDDCRRMHHSFTTKVDEFANEVGYVTGSKF